MAFFRLEVREGDDMSGFEFALLIGAMVAALVSYGDRRAWLWLAVIAANYIVTSAYYALGFPSHPFFTALVDASVCFAILLTWEHRWEKFLYWIFAGSVAVDLFRLFLVIDGNAYATALEIANWLAILAIGGPHIVEMVDARLAAWGHRNRYISRAHLFLSAARPHPSPHRA